MDIDGLGLAGCRERVFDTVECKRPIFLHANFGERIVACNICYLSLLSARYWVLGFWGLWGGLIGGLVIKQRILEGLRGMSIGGLVRKRGV